MARKATGSKPQIRGTKTASISSPYPVVRWRRRDKGNYQLPLGDIVVNVVDVHDEGSVFYVATLEATDSLFDMGDRPQTEADRVEIRNRAARALRRAASMLEDSE